MIIKKIVFIAIILVLFFSCNNHPSQIYSVREQITDSFYLPLPKLIRGKIPVRSETFWLENQKILATIYGTGHHNFPMLFFYNLTTKKLIHTIDLRDKFSKNFFDFHELFGFHFFSKDSILLFWDQQQFESDSTIILIDYNGKVKKIFPINNPYLATHKQWYQVDTPQWLLLDFFENNPIVVNNKVVFSLRRYCEYNLGTSDYMQHPPSAIVAYYDIGKDSLVLNKEITYPFIREKDYYNSRIYLALTPWKTILVGFSYTPLLYEWSLETNKIIHTRRLSSQIIDTIYPDTIPIEYSKTQPEFSYIDYVPPLNMFVRKIFFPRYTYGNYGFLTVYGEGKNIKYAGETPNVLFDFNTFSTRNYLGAYVFFYKNKNYHAQYSKNRDSVKLVVKSWQMIPGVDTHNISMQIVEMKEKIARKREKELCSVFGSPNLGYYKEKLKKYLKHFGINDSTFAVIIIHTSDGCPPCREEIINFLNINSSVIFNTNTYLILVDVNKENIDFALNMYKLELNKKIIFDTSNTYQRINKYKDLNNPRLILCKDGHIVRDSIYAPNNITNGFIGDYIKFLGFEK